MKAADCLIMPSLWEGFPITTIEGQAAGLAVICSDRVSRTVDVTGNCNFVPLDEEKWVTACLNSKKGSADQLNKVIDAGFDIKDAAVKLMHLYIDHC